MPSTPKHLSTPTTVGALVHTRSRAGGDRPALTFVSATTGERTELGWATYENWVAKSTNLLMEELELTPGALVDVRLPTHWTTAVLLLACWRAGLVVRCVDGDEPAAAAILHEGVAAPPLSDLDLDRLGDAVVRVGDGFGGRLAAPPRRGVGFAEEVLGFGDDVLEAEISPGAEALRADEGGDGPVAAWTHGQLLARAAAVADEVGLSAGGRLLASGPLDTTSGLTCSVLAALVADAGLVLAVDHDPEAWDRLAAAERCTARTR